MELLSSRDRVMQPTPTNTLGLRPIPGPDPVTMPDYTTWIWAIPLVLISILAFWWTRQRPGRVFTPLEQLEAILDKTKPVPDRFLRADHLLREYLAWRHDPAWLTTTSNATQPLWKALFPEDADLALGRYLWFTSLDACRFGKDILNEEQLFAYCLEVQRLITHVESQHEKEVKRASSSPA